jgi:hypothetical protein
VPLLAPEASEPELVGLAVGAVVVASLLRTSDNRARVTRHERLGCWKLAELGHADPERVGLVKV